MRSCSFAEFHELIYAGGDITRWRSRCAVSTTDVIGVLDMDNLQKVKNHSTVFNVAVRVEGVWVICMDLSAHKKNAAGLMWILRGLQAEGYRMSSFP